jgi:hypothetical protein
MIRVLLTLLAVPGAAFAQEEAGVSSCHTDPQNPKVQICGDDGASNAAKAGVEDAASSSGPIDADAGNPFADPANWSAADKERYIELKAAHDDAFDKYRTAIGTLERHVELAEERARMQHNGKGKGKKR